MDVGTLDDDDDVIILDGPDSGPNRNGPDSVPKRNGRNSVTKRNVPKKNAPKKNVPKKNVPKKSPVSNSCKRKAPVRKRKIQSKSQQLSDLETNQLQEISSEYVLDLGDISKIRFGIQEAEKEELLQSDRVVRALTNVYCRADRAWTLKMLKKHAPLLEELELIYVRREHLLATLDMPLLQKLRIAEYQNDVLTEPILLNISSGSPLPKPSVRVMELGTLPRQTVESILRIHQSTLEELVLCAGTPRTGQTWVHESWPYYGSYLELLLQEIDLKRLRSFTLDRKHTYHARLRCVEQRCAVGPFLPRTAILCTCCHSNQIAKEPLPIVAAKSLETPTAPLAPAGLAAGLDSSNAGSDLQIESYSSLRTGLQVYNDGNVTKFPNKQRGVFQMGDLEESESPTENNDDACFKEAEKLLSSLTDVSVTVKRRRDIEEQLPSARKSAASKKSSEKSIDFRDQVRLFMNVQTLIPVTLPNHMCPVCGKQFIFEAGLQCHIKTHGS